MFDKIKKQLQLTKGPKDWDLEYDICMKCGRRLEDKKYSTWKKHQDTAHRATLSEKRKMFFARHPIFTVIITMIAVMIILPTLEGPIDQFGYYANKALHPNQVTLTSDQVSACAKQVIQFKQHLYESKTYTSNDIQTLNDLSNNCNLELRISQFGPSIFNDVTYKPLDTTQTK